MISMTRKKCHKCGKVKSIAIMHQLPYGELVSNDNGTASYKGGQWVCDDCEHNEGELL